MVSVAVDATSLSDGSQRRGIGTYLREVLAGVAAEPEFVVTALAARETPLPDAVRRAAMPSGGHPRVRALRHDLRLPRAIRSTGCDVFHSPAQSPPRRSPVPWVQTLHDLTPLVFHDPRLEPERRRWLRYASRLRRADAVICVSRSSARQGIELLGLDSTRVHVAHLGVNEAFTPGPKPEASGDRPYILLVATWGPHKGFREAIAAIGAVADSGLPHHLVIAGYQTEESRARIDEEVRRAGQSDRVTVLEYVDDIIGVYRGADVALVPSYAEGFGLPVLEAMACGIPVLAADSTSLPEVAGRAGVILPTGDARAWGDATVRLLGDLALRADLGAKGIAHAATFTWQRTVRKHVEILRSLA